MSQQPYNPHEDPELEGQQQDPDATAPPDHGEEEAGHGS